MSTYSDKLDREVEHMRTNLIGIMDDIYEDIDGLIIDIVETPVNIEDVKNRLIDIRNSIDNRRW